MFATSQATIPSEKLSRYIRPSEHTLHHSLGSGGELERGIEVMRSATQHHRLAVANAADFGDGGRDRLEWRAVASSLSAV